MIKTYKLDDDEQLAIQILSSVDCAGINCGKCPFRVVVDEETGEEYSAESFTHTCIISLSKIIKEKEGID